ncbi:hypothetical protein [Aquirufa aurantiipilula]|uniref:hypothetical protein n=1 Tax=Aquirufa aurantiipilula TaxID=2696561 RepID=UPI001CAA6EDA|nr:hypothetical protein [Aquirufa aurantiipilula]MBZ1327019.1 hypothetical protein [Aquirufa aurantiipilula]
MTISSIIDKNISQINQNWYDTALMIFDRLLFKKGEFLEYSGEFTMDFYTVKYDEYSNILEKFPQSMTYKVEFKISFLDFITSTKEYYNKSTDILDNEKINHPERPERVIYSFSDITSIVNSLVEQLVRISKKINDKTFNNFYRSIFYLVEEKWDQVTNPQLLHLKDIYIDLFTTKINEAFELKFDLDKFQISDDKLQLLITKEHLAALARILWEAKLFEDKESMIDFISKYFWVKDRYGKNNLHLDRSKFLKSFKNQGNRTDRQAPLDEIISKINKAYESIIQDKML